MTDAAVAVFADFQQSSLGLPSRLSARLGGAPLLVHTLRRVQRMTGYARRLLVVRERDVPAAAEILAQLRDAAIDLLPCDDGQRRRGALVRAARRWGPASWRGTPLGATWFDEYVEPRLVERVLERVSACGALLCLEGHQPAVDVDIAASMLAHLGRQPDARFVFTQAPPGLAGILLTRDTALALAQNAVSVGMLLSYHPDATRADPIARAECCRVAPQVSQLAQRFTGDTQASFALLAAGLDALGADADAQALCDWTAQRRTAGVDAMPIEIEIELTTDELRGGGLLRPQIAPHQRRALMSAGPLRELGRQIAAWDDGMLALGGHGDPLLSELFVEALRAVRSAGYPGGLAVTTPLLRLDAAQLDALHSAQVDVLEAQLDAHTPATYAKLNGMDGFAAARENVRRLMESRASRRLAAPIVAPSMTRCAATLDEMEPFVDDWTRAGAAPVLRGHSHYADALPPDSALPTHPPVRQPCRRLTRRLLLLADGTAAACSVDHTAQMRVGNWFDESITDIWRGQALAALRAAHAGGNLPHLCRACEDWHRH